MKNKHIAIMVAILIASFCSGNAQTTVSSLTALRSAVQSSNQSIVLAPGNYNIEELSNNHRSFQCSGSNNTIDLTDVYIEFPVGSSDLAHFLIEGDNVTILGGEFENTYYNGMTEITDFEAYNNDRSRLASGGDPHIKITGDANGTIINGTKMTIRGSFPYGYGSLFGIGSSNTYGLDKRGGIEVRGLNTTIENCELQMQAFGHAIYIQAPADNTVIKNTLVEGRVRPVAAIVAESSSSLPGRNDYKDNDGNDMDPTDVISLCEDGYRVYTGGGSVTVDNSVAKKTRGGMRLYLASSATVTNSTAIDCGATNWNLPSGADVINGSGNFSYATLSDFRLSRNNMDIEWTIIPSPNATGPHNVCDVLGSNHNIVFHRTSGPIDTTTRPIVITGDNSTIVNETEYRIILESSASGNTIITCGSVIDNGFGNTITYTTGCFGEPVVCADHDAFSRIEAEDFCDESGINLTSGNVRYIEDGDWISFEDVDFGAGADSMEVSVSSGNAGGTIEVRQGSESGNLLGSVEVENTGSWTTWETVTATISGANGVQDLYLVFKGGSSYLMDINWFEFGKATTEFVPDPNKTYYIDSAFFSNTRLAASGEDEDPDIVSTNTTGDHVEWKFVATGNGYWHIDLASGGSKPRLRSRNQKRADMQPNSSSGDWTHFQITQGAIAGSYCITLPDGPGDYVRLQIDNSGAINMVENTRNGTWESFIITEASGSTSGTCDVPWTRSDFEVTDRLVNNTSETIDISCESRVTIAMDLASIGNLEDNDYLNIYYTVDGGSPQVISENSNSFSSKTVSVEGISGNSLVLIFQSLNSYYTETYFVSNVLVSSGSQANKEIDTAAKASQVKMYPNPLSSSEVLNISIPGSTSTRIDVINIAGQRVHSENFMGSIGNINIKHLRAGLYIVKMVNENQFYFKQLVINK